MNKPNIQTTKPVVPMLYGYSTLEVICHNGWMKIGYTEKDVETRINQQTHTADIKWKLEWKGNATFDDGSGETFIDKDFHAYLRKSRIEQEKGKNNEWFHVDGVISKQMFRDFREDHGILKTTDTVIPYKLRDEQQSAVAMTVNYLASHENGEFLWNAKPRFGKTLSVYDFVKKTGAEKVLIVTNRPAIANSWFSDYSKFLGSELGYLFVSEVDALKEKRGVLTRGEYTHFLSSEDSGNVKCIEFVSLQDMKGSIYFGGQYDKLGEVANMEWTSLLLTKHMRAWIPAKQMLHLTVSNVNLRCTCQVHHLKHLSIINLQMMLSITGLMQMNKRKREMGMLQRRKKIRMQHYRSLISTLIRCRRSLKMSYSRV